jgi:hypothetical protein
MANELQIADMLKELIESTANYFEEASYGSSGFTMPPTISIKGNKFTLVKDGQREPPPDPHKLDFVVIMTKSPKTRVFWGKDNKYDPNEDIPPTPPECQSFDGVTPEEGVPKRQHPTCAGCEQAIWGSAHSAQGKPIPACRVYRTMVVKIVGVDGPWLFGIPPASDKNTYPSKNTIPWSPLMEHMKKIEETERAKHGRTTITLSTCIIQATFVDDVNGVIGFRPTKYLSDKSEIEKITELRRSPEVLQTILWGPKGKARKDQWDNKDTKEVVNPSPTPIPTTTPIPPPKQSIANFPKQANANIEPIRQRTTRTIKPPAKEDAPKATNEVDDIISDMGITTFNE